MFMKHSLSKLGFTEIYLTILILLIGIVSVLALYSAAGGNWDPWAYKQMLRLCLGIFAMFIVAMVDVRVWRMYSYIFYFCSLLLLIFVEIKGHIGMGAQRWIDLKIINLQPSEIMKISLIMALSQYFHDKYEEQIVQVKTYLVPLLLIAIPCTLVMRQPDLGTMIVLAVSGAVIIFMSGIKLWKVLTTIGLIGTSLPFLWRNMLPYQKRRIFTLLNPESDPLGSGYHIIQSKISIGSGGFWGKGFLQGSQSQLQFLPEKQTDFIFAHFCEEFGILGGSTLIFIYTIIIIIMFKITTECKSFYSRLYCIGFTFLFFFYSFVNIGMVIGLLPVVGVPLPFMSYGGTSMLSLLVGFGIMISCHLRRNQRFGKSY